MYFYYIIYCKSATFTILSILIVRYFFNQLAIYSKKHTVLMLFRAYITIYMSLLVILFKLFIKYK